MASIAPALERIKQQLQEAVSGKMILDVFAEQGVGWRKRKLSPVLNVQLLLLQLLAHVAFSALRHVAGLDVSPQAICQARQRIPLKVFLQIVESFCRRCMERFKPARDFHHHRVVLVDATSFLAPDTPELSTRLGKAKNQRGTSQWYPVPKLLALLDASTGLIYQVIALPWARQERTCLTRLFKRLSPGDLILGDRGLVGFCQMFMLQAHQLEACMRLPRWQVVFGKGRANRLTRRKLGQQDKLMWWNKSDRRPTWLSRRKWGELPGQLTLRQISFRICRRGYRTQWAWLITTLLDPEKYPAEEIVALYTRRWQVEVYFRDLKQTLGMKQLRSRSLQGVRKEIVGFVLLYNLIRCAIADAAARQHTDPERISFKDAMLWLLYSADPEATLRINARRVRPTQPRMIKQGRRRYACLRRPRDHFQRPAYEARL